MAACGVPRRRCLPVPSHPIPNRGQPHPLFGYTERYTFFRKLGVLDLLAIAYRETVESSAATSGFDKSSASHGNIKHHHVQAELDLKAWHKLVVGILCSMQGENGHDTRVHYKRAWLFCYFHPRQCGYVPAPPRVNSSDSSGRWYPCCIDCIQFIAPLNSER